MKEKTKLFFIPVYKLEKSSFLVNALVAFCAFQVFDLISWFFNISMTSSDQLVFSFIFAFISIGWFNRKFVKSKKREEKS